MNLSLLNQRLAICRLEPALPVPEWTSSATGFLSITHAGSELSIVCAESIVPAGVQRETGWRAFKVAGPLDFTLTGILASLAVPLATAGVSIFAISTYDTDYVLVKEDNVEKAVRALQEAGHRVELAISEDN